MAVKTTLSEIAHGALGSSFLNAIKVMYRQTVEGGVFETVESEYEAGVRELNAVFSSEQTDRLAEYEHTCSGIRDYSARYGFLAAALEQNCAWDFWQDCTVDSNSISRQRLRMTAAL